ncbi:MAG: hypothetical protein ACAI44_10780, partial [Candidatus Sericytochromatia bacterium]
PANHFHTGVLIGNIRQHLMELEQRALEVTLSGRPVFAEQVRKLRLNNQMGLRAFCKSAKVDAAHWSRIERQLAAPPTDKETLERIGQTLQLNPISLPMRNLVAAAENWRPP